jgi:hypothetical protein
MNSTPVYYKPSGKVNIFRLPLTLLLIVPIWLIGFLYAGLLHWNPLTFLGPVILFIYAFAISQIIVLGINLSEVRNRQVAIILAVIFSLFALYFSWSQFVAIWLDSFPVRLLNIENLWAGITKLYQEGAFTAFGITINGVLGAIIWLLEAAIVFVFAIFFANATVADEVYCSSCKKWVKSIEKFYEFGFDDEGILTEKVATGDFTWLDQSRTVNEADKVFYRIDTSCCNTCSKSNYVSLIKVSREIKEGESAEATETTDYLHKNIKLDQRNFARLYQKSDHWLHFTESGKFKHSLWLGVPAMAFVIYMLGWLYQSISRWAAIYFITGILFFGLIIVLFYATRLILERFQSRNSVISNYFGLMVGVMALYLTNMATFASADIFIWHPDYLWLGLSELNNAHELSGLAWTGFIIESLGLLLVPFLAASYVATDRVYCEQCDEWAHEEDDLLIFQYESEEELIEKFRSQDTSFLNSITEVPYTEDKIEYFRINAEWCETCSSIYTLSLEKVTQTYDFRDRTFRHSFKNIYEDLIYSEEHFNTVMDFARKWMAELQNSAKEVEKS